MAAACLLWLLCLVVLSVIPYSLTENLPETGSDFRWDYPEHFAGYLLLAILAGLWLADKKLSLGATTIIIIIVSGGAISFALEYIQLFIPGRSFNLVDVAFNATGLLAGLFTVYFLLLPSLLRQSK